MAVDPPYRLDPLQNIVNVKWSPPIVCYIEGLNNSPQGVVAFTQSRNPKTAPTFGTRKNVPTATASNNQVVPAHDTSNQLTITGNQLIFTLPTALPNGLPDYRGYSTLQGYTYHPTTIDFAVVQVPVQDGTTIYFDPTGARVISIPAISTTVKTRGLSVASDDDGTVYMLTHTYAAVPDNRGVTKYNADGDILWRITNAPDTIFYERENNRLRFTYAFAHQIKYYGLDGILQSTTNVSDFTTEEFTKKGKLYAKTSATDTLLGGLRCVSSAGSPLWTIAGDPIATGYQFASLAAYGEEFLVVSMVRNVSLSVPSVQPVVSGSLHRYRVYNANTGALVTDTQWGDHIQAVTSTTIPGSPPVDTSNRDQVSYGFLAGPARQDYWP